MKIRKTVSTSLDFLGAAIKEGQTVGGVEKGPSLIRNAGLFNVLKNRFGVEVNDHGDISIQNINLSPYAAVQHPIRNLNRVGPVLNSLHSKAQSILAQSNNILLTVGGDHSIGSATISAMLEKHPNLRVIWVDAHPDMTNHAVRNPVGQYHCENYHGMPLSHLIGATTIPAQLPYFDWINKAKKLNPKHVALIGIRDIDPDEYDTIRNFGVAAYSVDHIDLQGIGPLMSKILKQLDPEGTAPFHISFDVDAIDPDVLSQTGTRFRYGLSGRQAMHIVRRTAHERKVVGMDIVQINEDMNRNEEKRLKYRGEDELRDVSHTVGIGIDLATSLFTKYLTI